MEGEIPTCASDWCKDKENQPDRQRCDQPSSRVTVGEKNGQCRLENIMGPLNVRRLRPIRQKTRNVVLSILEDETVCLEFIKSKGSDIYVTEVLRISSDGNKITSYTTNGREGVVLQEKPPPIPRTAVSYAFSGLPRKLWKKYQYADKFIRLVRMKSPKVSLLQSILPELCFCISYKKIHYLIIKVFHLETSIKDVRTLGEGGGLQQCGQNRTGGGGLAEVDIIVCAVALRASSYDEP